MGALKLRYGICDRLEVSAQYGAMTFNNRAEFSTPAPDFGEDNTDYFGFAVKGLILKGSGVIPTVGASIEYNYGPFSSEKLRANIAAESRFFEKMGVRVNLGYTYQGNAHIGLQANYAITDHWKVFGEYSGNISDVNVLVFAPNDFPYYQLANTTAGVVWNINANSLFGVSGTYYINSIDASFDVEKAQSLALNVSFSTRIDWGK